MAYIFIGSSATILVMILFGALAIGALLKHKQWDRYLPASVASILFGFFIGAMMNFGDRKLAQAFHFSPAIFFFLLLPPIMFDAGFSVRRKMFFKNFGTILVFAFVGTFVSCVFFGLIMWMFAAGGGIPIEGGNPLEGLVYGGLISATDPVAVLALLNSDEVNVPPTLYSVVFGESMLNDAIAIVLYNLFRDLLPVSGGGDFTFLVFLKSIGNFMFISIGSTAVGFAVALVSAFITRAVDLTHYHSYEVTVVFLFAWLSYVLCEAVHLSGIMAIFFTGIGMAHYTFYNISKDAQVASRELFHSFAHMAETFVFCYIGITVGLSIEVVPLKWSVPMMFAATFATFASRALHVFPLSWVVNRFRKEKIPLAMQIPIWWAGLRGAVAVALSLDFPCDNTNIGTEEEPNYGNCTAEGVNTYVVTSTLVVVLVTTILCGGTTGQVLNRTGMNLPRAGSSSSSSTSSSSSSSSSSNDAAMSLFSGMAVSDSAASGGHGHGDDEDEDRDEFRTLRETINGDLHSRWLARFRRFDRTFMRKWFGGNPKSSLLAEDHQESGPSTFVPPRPRSDADKDGDEESHAASSYTAPSAASSYSAPAASSYSAPAASSSSAPYTPFVPSYLQPRSNGAAASAASAAAMSSSSSSSTQPFDVFANTNGNHASPSSFFETALAAPSAPGLFDESPAQPESAASSFDFMS